MRNVIEMALKLLFYAAKSQNSPSGWGLCPQARSVTSLSSVSLFSTIPKLGNFCSKKIYFEIEL